MKKVVLLIVFTVLSIYSQALNNPSIMKTETFGINYQSVISIKQITPDIVYFFTYDELFVCLDFESKLTILNILPFKMSSSANVVINENLLYIVDGDSISRFSIVNASNPIFTNRYKIPGNYTGFLSFGPYMIMLTPTIPKLIIDTGDSLKVLAELAIYGANIRADYPYISGVNANTIYLQKMLSDLSVFIVNTLALPSISGYNMLNRRLVILEQYIIVNNVPVKYIEIYQNNNGEFNLVSRNSFGLTIGAHYASFQEANENYMLLSESGGLNGMNVRLTSGTIVYSYPVGSKAFLGSSKYFAISNGLYVCKNKVSFPELYSFPSKGWVIKKDNNFLYLLKKTEDNYLDTLSVIGYTGSISNADSALLVKSDTNYKVLKVNQNELFLHDNFSLSSTIKDFEYYDKYIVSASNSGLNILVKVNNTYNNIYSDQEITRGCKASIKLPFLYYADSVKGVFRYKLTELIVSDKKRIRYSPQSKYTIALKHPYLFVKENDKIIIYDVSNENVPPVQKDSLLLSTDMSDIGFIVTPNDVYIRGKINNNSTLSKLKKINNRWDFEYSLNLDFDLGAFSLTEDYKRLFVTGNMKGVWIKDTLIVLDSKEKNPITEIRGNSLEQNYPNPFNPSTKISYSIAKRSRVSLKIYDIMGREIETLIDKEQEEGVYKIDYTPKNLSSGIYFYTLNAENYRETKKLVYIK